MQLSNFNCSIQWQRSRIRWMKKGDANRKFFHGFINKRRKENELLSIKINGKRLNEVDEIKMEESLSYWERKIDFGQYHLQQIERRS